MIIYWIQVCQLENYDENVSLKPNRPNNREREVVRKEREREKVERSLNYRNSFFDPKFSQS